jgi:hypothetical protein
MTWLGEGEEDRRAPEPHTKTNQHTPCKIGGQKFSDRHFRNSLQGVKTAMKKNKRASGNDGEASGTADMIAVEALESLASKLKADLAKPVATPKPAPKAKPPKRKDHKPKDDRKEAENKAVKKKDGHGKPKAESKEKMVMNGHGGNKQPKFHEKSTGSKKKDKEESARVQLSKIPEKPASKVEKKSTHSQESRHNRKGSTSLLDEILALGGTKEDLELVGEISSDEELVAYDKRTAKEKGDEDTVFSNFLNTV